MYKNYKISGFCDEASTQIITQFETIKKLGVEFYEPRIVNDKNISYLTEEETAELLATMKKYGIKATSIGSPIGKIKPEDDFEAHFELYKNTVKVAKALDCKYIRMFSFFLPEGEDYDTYTDFVVERLTRMVKYAEQEGVILLHENEKGIYGNIARRCKVLFEKIPSPNFRAVFDFSNFIECNQETMEAYEMLKPYIEYIHIKDNHNAEVVLPAGKGDGKIEEILRDLYKNGYDGYLSLEPHLFDYAIPQDASELVKSFETDKQKTYAIAYESLVEVLDRL